MRCEATSSNRHVASLLQFLEPPADIRRIVLTIRIHEYENYTRHRTRSGLDGRPVALALRMTDTPYTRRSAELGWRIGRGVVDY
jgi:hypothetical protein